MAVNIKIIEIEYLKPKSAIHQEVPILPPEMADLCNVNSNRKWVDFFLNRYRRDFKSLWGPNGTKTAILIYNKIII